MSLARSLRGILTFLVLLALLAGPPTSSLTASELEDSSIRLIPTDAAFYGASLRNGEQIKIIAESNAWKKLVNMPAVQNGLEELKTRLENAEDERAAQAQAVLENPQVKDLLGLLADMFSEDVFFYGAADVGEVLELAQDVGNATNYGPMYFEAAGEADTMSQPEMQAKAALYTLADNIDQLKIPTMVLGFAVEDEDRALVHLGKLEGFFGLLALMQPKLAGSVIHQEVDGSEFLTLTLKGKMIPWQDVPLEDLRELEAREGDVDQIVEKVKELELVVAFGVREGYLMMALTDSVDKLSELGQGESLLTHPKMDVVKKFADERLTGISYTSEDFVARMSLSTDDIDGLLMIGETALKEAALDEEAKERIRKDMNALADDLKSLVPEPGAAVGVSFLTGEGVESYKYNWTQNEMLDGSNPLALLHHVGSDPLLAAVWREDKHPDVYDRFIHWVRVGHGYFREFGLPEMSEKERKQYEKAVKQMKPHFQDLVDAGENLIAACDGEAAMVIDAQMKSKKIAADVPETEEPMPLPEPALVIGIEDADAMRQAYVSFQRFCNGALEVAREFDEEGEIPEDYEIPWPAVSETADRSTLSYTLPEKWQVDYQIKPNAVLTEDVAVVTASEGHTERLLQSTPIEAGGALAETDKSRAVAVSFNWPATVDALSPWLRLAAREAARENLGVGYDDPQIDNVLSQLETVLEVLKTVRHCTVECYVEEGALVTHGLMEVQDIQ